MHKYSFLKLDIPFINKYYKALDDAKVKWELEHKKLQEDWNRKKHEEAIQLEIERRDRDRARTKLKIVDSEIPKPEMKVERHIPKPPLYPPYFVKLLFNRQNEPYLHVDVAYGSIDRALDPETYDRWLNYLLQSAKNNSHSEILNHWKVSRGIPIQ